MDAAEGDLQKGRARDRITLLNPRKFGKHVKKMACLLDQVAVRTRNDPGHLHRFLLGSDHGHLALFKSDLKNQAQCRDIGEEDEKNQTKPEAREKTRSGEDEWKFIDFSFIGSASPSRIDRVPIGNPPAVACFDRSDPSLTNVLRNVGLDIFR